MPGDQSINKSSGRGRGSRKRDILRPSRGGVEERKAEVVLTLE